MNSDLRRLILQIVFPLCVLGTIWLAVMVSPLNIIVTAIISGGLFASFVGLSKWTRRISGIYSGWKLDKQLAQVASLLYLISFVVFGFLFSLNKAFMTSFFICFAASLAPSILLFLCWLFVERKRAFYLDRLYRDLFNAYLVFYPRLSKEERQMPKEWKDKLVFDRAFFYVWDGGDEYHRHLKRIEAYDYTRKEIQKNVHLYIY